MCIRGARLADTRVLTMVRETLQPEPDPIRNAGMMRKIFVAVLAALSIAAIGYGGFVRQFRVFDNLEKFDALKGVGITLKLPGMDQQTQELQVQSQWFTEPEVVNAMTFDGIGRYKDGRLISKYPDLRMLKGRRPCPT